MYISVPVVGELLDLALLVELLLGRDHVRLALPVTPRVLDGRKCRLVEVIAHLQRKWELG